MKSSSKSILLFILLITFSISHGQNTQKHSTNKDKETNYKKSVLKTHENNYCGSDNLTKEWISTDDIKEQYSEAVQLQNLNAQNLSGDRSTYVVPIIFHIVHNPDNPSENLSQSAIQNLVDNINLDFSANNLDLVNLRSGYGWNPASANIEFCLAQKDPFGNNLTEAGIHRVTTNEDYFMYPDEKDKMKSSTGGGTGTEPWDRDNYINIWVCDILNGASSGVAGYALRPTISALPPIARDGIVIDYNKSTTDIHILTHELGHFLGLQHTWGSSNTATGCADDDGLSDTPLTAGPSFDYWNSCDIDGIAQITCTGIVTQYENFMDYSDCTIMFTQQQTNLMTQILTGVRASLTTTNVCNADAANISKNLSTSIIVYPNPNQGELFIHFNMKKSKKIDVEIINLAGTSQFHKSFDEIKNEKLNFSLNSLENGVYFVKISSKDESTIRKIVIQK